MKVKRLLHWDYPNKATEISERLYKKYKPQKMEIKMVRVEELDNTEALNFIKPGCVIEYVDFHKFYLYDAGWYDFLLKYTHFREIQSESETKWIKHEYNLHYILAVFEQDEKTSELKLLYTRPIPKIHYEKKVVYR